MLFRLGLVNVGAKGYRMGTKERSLVLSEIRMLEWGG